jgi:hypothetical protein
VLFEQRLTNVLATAGRIDELEAYTRRFPSWKEIESEFRVEVDGPIAVPSLAELAKQTPDMQRWMQSIHQQMQRDLPRVADDICGTVAELLTKLEQVEPNLTPTQVGRLSKGISRLESLCKLHDSMSQVGLDSPVKRLALKVCALGAQTTALRHQEALAHSLSILRADLKDSELVFGGGKGAKALAQWVNGAGVEEKVKALVAELEQLQQESPGLSDEEREARLAEIRIKVQSQAGLLNHAAARLLEMLETPEPQVDEPALEAQSKEQDLDVLEAGF